MVNLTGSVITRGPVGTKFFFCVIVCYRYINIVCTLYYYLSKGIVYFWYSHLFNTMFKQSVHIIFSAFRETVYIYKKA